MEQKKELISYFQNANLFFLGIFLLGFPLIVANVTTDAVIIPKQVFLAAIATISLILFGLKVLAEKSVKIRRTYFDLPLFLVALASLLSSLFAINRFDSFIALVPFLLSILLYFLIVNTVRNENSMLFLISSLSLGAVLVSISALLSFFKIYVLPFAATHVQSFTPLGSLLEQAIYLGVILTITLSFAKKLVQDRTNMNGKDVFFGSISIVIALGFLITLYQLVTTQKPLILPFQTGFQISFAAISQDSSRIIQGFLFGSGLGTFAADFSRFKQAAFNQNPALWSLTFVRSASFVLELLATAGILGLSAFIFLIVRVIQELKEKGLSKYNNLFISLGLIFILTILLPLSLTAQTLIFIILGLFAAIQAVRAGKDSRFFEVEIQLVALKKGLISLESPAAHQAKTIALPVLFLICILVIAGAIGFSAARYLLSDISFQSSLVFAAKNNGQETYQKQAGALGLFPYRDLYYRVFSQTNLALANSLASQTPAGQTPSAQNQQTITTLIQQSINAGRQATTLAPLTAANWQNLSSIYRSLIGFGQNAEAFALTTQQQSTALDPNNPQQYISLGGIYYQLGQWDNAQNQFQIAVNLKPDLANAYYNLGHTLEQKGDLTSAMTQYQTVKTLVANDKNSLEQINKEIGDLQARIQTKSETQTSLSGTPNQPLNIDTPANQLPPRNPPIEIPAPSATQSGR